MQPCIYHVRLIVVGAYNIPNVSTMGKLDAFAKITYQDIHYCTSVLHNCGTNPLWNYIVNFNGTEPKIQIALYDKRLLNDKYIGEINLDCSRIPHGDHCFSIPLTDHGTDCGDIGKLRINISLTKNINDYSHHHTIKPLTLPPISMPSSFTQATPLVPIPRTPSNQGVLLSEHPDFIHQNQFRRVPNYDNSPHNRGSYNRQLYPSPVESVNRRANQTYYHMIPSKY